MLKQQIAERLEQAFSQFGFAEPNVAQLKTACQVSLRTLYKHYPSKEAMIVAALDFRHQRYLDFLQDNAPEAGTPAIEHIFQQLQGWMETFAPHGCLSVNALSAYPENAQIHQAVTEHKQAVIHFLGQQSLRPDLAHSLFLLHEGVSSAWPVLGQAAVTSALHTIQQLLEDTTNDIAH
ncbi:TetR/AcrR family transcriptional regulator [Marinomonas aquiplantarum]|uniref:TetR family transcriptional regulator n=1 Tax=Marinomonas aquiplantarum TaxID=491951 RepID=A0A366CW38_9GAMM|nr:TetR/AcrR family transcriptional regulator [Marinomonas aquiplantarum]RBO81876.1 TetR family transcriptional regulator [Marinomonas aquiplantarum]